MTRVERADGPDPIGPELVLVDPDLAARVRASPAEPAAPFVPAAEARPHRRRLKGLLGSAAALAGFGALTAFGLSAGTEPAAAQYQYGGNRSPT
jgi:hypothetical protein